MAHRGNHHVRHHAAHGSHTHRAESHHHVHHARRHVRDVVEPLRRVHSRDGIMVGKS